jgi:glycosyltransferase involved in cell wall biosynthesis
MAALLSVVMPTYNGEEYLAAALESVRQQFDDNLELIIVDDGSSDRTLDIIHSFSQKLPLRLITPGRIGNWVAATNIGLRQATGEWACFLHQDDLWLPGRIATIRSAIGNARGSLIIHNAKFIGPKGQSLGPSTCPLPVGDVPSDLFIERLLVQNFVALPSPVFRRSVVIESGGLDESLWFSADWDLWLRLGALGQVHFINQTLVAFRVHPASQTAARKIEPREWEQQLSTVLNRHLSTWSTHNRQRNQVERVARYSIRVNSALSAISRGKDASVLPLLTEFLTLGPTQCRRYLRDSRIVQRLIPRLKIQGLPIRKR